MALAIVICSGLAFAQGTSPNSWSFIASGDSRNCGDMIVPAIASNSAQFSPGFYWHLGDLRAIYKVDEDIAFSTANHMQAPACDAYERIAWSDFVEQQIGSFGNRPFYVGIGNHEVIPPKNEAAFEREFYDWLNLPVLQAQRAKDNEPAEPQPYYHWIQGGVDFIYLDNATGVFSDPQLTWLQHRLDAAKQDIRIKSVVVGMHEALPDSWSNEHSMGDGRSGPEARASGQKAYKALIAFRDESHKPVYVLCSHSHFYMDHIFTTPELTKNGGEPLDGWLVGTAGAVRYPLPKNVPENTHARTDVYGYLLGEVSFDGTIKFSFHEVHPADVPEYVQQRYPATAVQWCFEHNSLNKDPHAPDPMPRCLPTRTPAKPANAATASGR